MADAESIKNIEDGFKTLVSAKDCRSLLKKYLTEDVLNKLKHRKTKFGATLWDVIQSGVQNLNSPIGVYAPDAESYITFNELFDPIIQDYHGFKPSDCQPDTDLGESRWPELVNLDPKYVTFSRIECRRSLSMFPFSPCLTEANYVNMEDKAKKVFETIVDPELRGKYYPLLGMTKEVRDQFADHFLFKEGDSLLQNVNANRYSPKGRGIFYNNNKNFMVCVNEEDHFRIISMQSGGDIGQVLDRLIRGVRAIEKDTQFSRNQRLGWLTVSPTNIGTTVRASSLIKIPETSKRQDFKKVCSELKLDIIYRHGYYGNDESSADYENVYLCNKASVGLTEFQAVKDLYDGVKKLIEMEKSA